MWTQGRQATKPSGGRGSYILAGKGLNREDPPHLKSSHKKGDIYRQFQNVKIVVGKGLNREEPLVWQTVKNTLWRKTI